MFVLEEIGKIHNHPYLIFMNSSHGARVGYVGVYADSPIYNLYYDDAIVLGDKESSLSTRIDVHGGLTYSGPMFEDIIGCEPIHWFGFDCMHYNDERVSIEEMEEVLRKALNKNYINTTEIINRYKQLYNLIEPFPDATVKSLEYVRNECKKLAKQIQKIEENM